MRSFVRSLLLVSILASTSAFSLQPGEERKAQDTLPQSHHALWADFAKCKVKLNPKTYMYSIVYTPDVAAMKGKDITINGFILPLDPTEKFKHFLLSKRTPTCPFCPPGEPNEIVEVFSAKPIEWKEDTISMTGKLELVNDGEKGIFFRMNDAAVATK